MKRFARTADDTIVEIFEAADKDALGELYHPDFVSALIEVPAGAQIGWVKSGSSWSEPSVAAPSKAELTAYAAQRRWEIETGGIDVAGQTVDTSRESQAMIAGADALAQADPEETVDYKTTTGWIELDAETMHTIALAVGRHVRSLFHTERQVCEAIEAGEITTSEQVDAAFAG